jgi:hypothetical protein
MINSKRILAGNPGEKEPHGKHKYKWEDNIKTGYEGVDRILRP